MIVIDWVPNGQGGWFANVMYDHVERQRWIWNGAQDRYVKLEAPEPKSVQDEIDEMLRQPK